jgi:CO/xanthine dehydrogenase FAD-binding subunit
VVIGAVGAAPKVFDGEADEADLEVMAQKAYDHAEGVDNLLMPGAYRRKIISVLVKRAIKAAMDGIKEGM